MEDAKRKEGKSPETENQLSSMAHAGIVTIRSLIWGVLMSGVFAFLTVFLLTNGAVLYYYITLALQDGTKYGAVKYYSIYIVIWVVMSTIIMYVKYRLYERIVESDRQKEEIEKLKEQDRGNGPSAE